MDEPVPPEELDATAGEPDLLEDAAAAEMERMTAVLLLLEDLRAGAEREPKLHLSMVRRKR